jgi:predicted nucleic acid-binding protein
MILVDTTIWIGLLRNQESQQVSRLRALLVEGDAVLAPVILQELLQGAPSAESLERLKNYFSALPMLGTRNLSATHIAAAELYAKCRWQGYTPRSPHDCLIAQLAIEHNTPLLHDDRDFIRIAEIDPRLILCNHSA